MTTTPSDPTTALPGRPPVVDLATWQAARDELLVREKAYTREGDALAAARRRLPMVELDGAVEVVGPDGPVPFLDLFQGRDELVVYKHMWYDGAPHQGQCEGCTTTAWHLKDAVYLNARGVSFAILTTGRRDQVASYVEFMGYTQPWYSVRGVEAPVGGSMGSITCFLIAQRLFEPLGYAVEATPVRADRRVSGSPASSALPTCSTTCTCSCPSSTTRSTTGSAKTRSRSCCATARAGSRAHPERELIVRRYLSTSAASPATRSRGCATTIPTRTRPRSRAATRSTLEQRVSPHEQRLGAVVAVLRGVRRATRASTSDAARAAARAACCATAASSEIVGVDVSVARARDRASERLQLDAMPDRSASGSS